MVDWLTVSVEFCAGTADQTLTRSEALTIKRAGGHSAFLGVEQLKDSSVVTLDQFNSKFQHIVDLLGFDDHRIAKKQYNKRD